MGTAKTAGEQDKPTSKDEKQRVQELLAVSVLEVHVKWCIFHEGCDVYFVPPGTSDQINDQMRSISDLRACYMQKESGNPAAQDLIRNANDDLLMQVTLQAAGEIPGDYSLRDHFSWVAYHEGSMVNYRIWNAQHNFSSIRTDYEKKEAGNPNARHLLSAVNNMYIFILVNSM
jgi:hypothetical protein